MGRGDERQSRVGLPGDSGGDVQAVIVDRDRHDVGSRGHERGPGPEVAGVLQPRRIAWIEQYPRAELQGLLRAGHDDDLVGGAADATSRPEVSGDRFAERCVSGRVVIAHQFASGLSHAGGDQPGPEVGWKGLERGQADLECGQVGRHADYRGQGNARGGGDPVAPGGQPTGDRLPVLAGYTRGPGRHQLVGEYPGNEGPRASAPFEITLGEKLLKRGENGVAGDAGLGGERATGWQPGSGRELAAEDSRPDLFVEPPVRWQGGRQPGACACRRLLPVRSQLVPLPA